MTGIDKLVAELRGRHERWKVGPYETLDRELCARAADALEALEAELAIERGTTDGRVSEQRERAAKAEQGRDSAHAVITEALAFLDGNWLAPFKPGEPGRRCARCARCRRSRGSRLA